jgi:hypothetical protein
LDSNDLKSKKVYVKDNREIRITSFDEYRRFSKTI